MRRNFSEAGETHRREVLSHRRAHPVRRDPLALRRVLALAEGRRPVHRRPSRRGVVPHGRGAGAACQHLGFEGFPELQSAARDEYRRAREGEQGTVDLANPPLFPIDQTEFEAALAADHVNVEETARKLDREEVAHCVELISRADRLVLCGTDQMAFFASYLRHLLMLLDVRCEVVASPSQEGLAKLGRIDDRTVLVGFSAGRPHPLVVRAMKLARNRNAATISVSDATLSEVAKLADHKLFYSSNSPAFVRSHAARMSDVEALAYGVYAMDD